MPVGVDQLRKVIADFEWDTDSDSDPEDSRPASRNSTSKGSSSSTSRVRAAAVAAAGGGTDRKKLSKKEEQIDLRFEFLKRVHGGSIPKFDDRNPDPGAAFEVEHYRDFLDPLFVSKADKKLEVRS